MLEGVNPPAIDALQAGPVFHHQAMATTWEIRLRTEDVAEARNAAGEAFREVDRLERLLSRFQEGGEIWCINHLKAGEQLHVNEETHECLLRAMRMHEVSGGAFHPGLGGVMDRVRAEDDWKDEFEALEQGCLVVDDESPIVACVAPGFQIDLGAIGKGYALDCIRKMLGEWGYSDMLLNAGGSSLLGTGGKWEVRLLGDSIRPMVSLQDMAVGSSGTSVQGQHIVDARSGAREAKNHRSWAFANEAAYADALSTAALLLNADEIEQMLATFGEPCVVLLETLEGNRLIKKLHSSSEEVARQIGLVKA